MHCKIQIYSAFCCWTQPEKCSFKQITCACSVELNMAKNARQFSFNLLTYNYMVSFQNESEYFKIETKAIKGIDPEKREAALETIIIIPNSHIVSDKVRLVLSDKKSKMLVGEKIICQLLIDSSGSIKGIKYIIPNKVFQLLTAQDFDIIDRLLRETLNFEIGDESVPYMMPGIKIEL